ncbi:lipopolysaccharide biosynthesis chain length determinant protein [alpha proteobacterium U9-1i]|nr:lipopolysaccharide biosynthesis chain length determinant protein [alpha proteobacterium U9-1i]
MGSSEAKTGPAFSGWSNTTRPSFADAIAMLWAERAWVIGVGAMICAIGLAVALLLPRTYTARTELLVRLGQEYVYQPTIGGAGAQGAAPEIQSVVNAEMRMIGSGAVVRRTIGAVGLATLYPSIAASPGGAARKLADAERAFAEHLTIETAPQTPAIGLSFAHENPEIAARALNALVDQYLAYRRTVLAGGEGAALAAQSTEVNTRAAAASVSLAAFLSEHEIGDFDAELNALAARSADTETQLFDAAARRGEAEARAASLRARFTAEPEEISLYSESDARRELVQAQVEREQLLSRYQDDAPPVREVDRRIAQLTNFLAGGDPASVTRRGANPVRQDLASQMYAADAEARAQRGRETALTRQRNELRERLSALRVIEPEFRQLLRERTILETNAQSFATRAEEARSFSELLGRSTDNISLVERAAVPTQAKSLRLAIALITLLIAGVVAIAVGLVRGLLRRGFPTPQAASRALEAPVLAVVPRAAHAAPQMAKQSPPPANDVAPRQLKTKLKLVEGAKP